MCNYKSGVITRDGRVFVEMDTDSHEEMVKRHALREGPESDPWANYISVECMPKRDLLSRKREDWDYRLDERDAKPAWYAEDEAHFEELFFTALYSHLDAREEELRLTGIWRGGLALWKGAALTAPGLETVERDIWLHEGATLTAPRLKTVEGDITLREGATLTAPGLKTVERNIWLREGVTLNAPKLSKVGDVRLYEGATLTAPRLKAVEGGITLWAGATLNAPKLER